MSFRTESFAIPVTTFANLVALAVLIAAGWHFMAVESEPTQEELSEGLDDADEISKTGPEIRAMLWRSGASAIDRHRAIESWASLGAAAIPTLTEALEVPDPTFRRSSVMALALMGSEARDAAPALRRLLADRDEAVQFAALTALLDIDADLEPSITEYVRFVRQSNIPLRNAAARCLTRCGPACVADVLPLAEATDPEVRRQAVMILDKVGYGDSRVEKVLRALLDDCDVHVRGDAFGALLERESLTRSEVLAALDAANPELARLALEAVSNLGEDGASAVRHLQELFAASDPELQDAILATCADIGPAARFAIPALRARIAEPVLTRHQLRRRRDAVRMMGRVGAGNPDVVAALVELLDDSDLTVVHSAGRALREHGGRAVESATIRLTARLDDRERSVRVAALVGLRGLGPAAASSIPALMARLSAAPRDEVEEIAAALGEMGPLAGDAVGPLQDLLEKRMELRDGGQAVIRALGQIGVRAETAVPVLSEILRESAPWLTLYNDELRLQRASRLVLETANALTQLGPAAAQAVPALVALLDQDVVGYDDFRIREQVLALMPTIACGDEEAEAAAIEIARILLYDASPHLRAVAAETLGALNRGRSADVIAELMAALNDESPYVRTAAALALGRQGPTARRAVPALEGLLRERHNGWRNQHVPPISEWENWNLGMYQAWNRISVHDAASQALQALGSAGRQETVSAH